MVPNTLTLVVALAAAATASPYVPALAARVPASATGPTAGKPTAIDLYFSNFYSSSTCDGPNITQTYHANQCITLDTPARSWRSSADVPTQQIEMSVYGNANCGAPGMVEHLDLGNACMTMGGLYGSSTNSSARSIYIHL